MPAPQSRTLGGTVPRTCPPSSLTGTRLDTGSEGKAVPATSEAIGHCFPQWDSDGLRRSITREGGDAGRGGRLTVAVVPGTVFLSSCFHAHRWTRWAGRADPAYREDVGVPGSTGDGQGRSTLLRRPFSLMCLLAISATCLTISSPCSWKHRRAKIRARASSTGFASKKVRWMSFVLGDVNSLRHTKVGSKTHSGFGEGEPRESLAHLLKRVVNAPRSNPGQRRDRLLDPLR